MPVRQIRCLYLLPVLALAVSCGGSSGSSTNDPATPPAQPTVPVGESLAAGDAKLQTGMTTLSTVDLLAAANAFRAGAAASSTDGTATQAQKDQANFFGGAALLVVLANPASNTATAGTLNTFGDILDAYGLGGTATDRAHLDTIRFVDCTAGSCKLKTFPANSPNSRDIQAFLLGKMGAALQGVIAALGQVSPAFQYRLAARGNVIEFDQTDALFLKGVAQGLLGMVQLQAAYDLGLDVDALQASAQPGAPAFSAPAFLGANPTLLTLTDATSLGLAKASFLAAVASAKAGVASLRAETDDQANDFIKLSNSTCSYTGFVYTCTTTYNSAADLDQVVAVLDEAASVLGATGPVVVSGTQVDPSKFFAGVSFRSKLPATWNAGPGANLPGFFPDPTFGGIFVTALPQVNADANGDGSPDWLMNLGRNFRVPRL
jgi:hypothetical protein